VLQPITGELEQGQHYGLIVWDRHTSLSCL
jgi:hypothetical protein